MSEKLPHHSEHQAHARESLDSHAIEQHRQNVEKSHDKQPKTDEVHRTIEHHAQSSAEYKAQHTAHDHHARPHHYITASVKKGVYAHTIRNVQSHLSPSERRFSKLIHSESVESLSELGASTVGRSSAIIGGGIFMVIGGATLLLMARYYGFSIPLSTLVALYIIGFIVIAVVDFLIKLVPKRSSRRTRKYQP